MKRGRLLCDIRRDAYHEAGHAISCLVYKISFRNVFVRFKKVTYKTKRCGGLNTDNGYIYGSPIERAVGMLCGIVSRSKKFGDNLIFCGGCGRGYGDINKADELIFKVWSYHSCLLEYKNLSKLYHPCYNKLRNDVLLAAQKLVDDNWEQICVVAEELAEKQRLEYDEVIRLLMNKELYYNLKIPENIRVDGK